MLHYFAANANNIIAKSKITSLPVRRNTYSDAVAL